jgi:hypothetical protein
MSLIPISKKSMQELHGIAEEEQHFRRVKEVIASIYVNSMNAAKDGLQFYSEVIASSHNLYSRFTKDVAKGIQDCFPDCDITIHADMAINPEMIQSTIEDTSILIYEMPGSSHTAYCIYIDWS